MSKLYFRKFQSRHESHDLVELDGRKALGSRYFSELEIPAGADPVAHIESLGYTKVQSKPWGYYPRMARPLDFMYPLYYPGLEADASPMALMKGQLLVLLDLLQSICRVIHPEPPNMHAYGHELRNLLILAATEIEASWKGVLAANGKAGKNTGTYISLLKPMRLDEFGVSFPLFPWLPERFPFRGWSHVDTTKSLPWYNAYNGVKHNREMEFNRATLQHAMDAVCANLVMLVAQYGVTAAQDITMMMVTTLPGFENSECYYRGSSYPSVDWESEMFSF